MIAAAAVMRRLTLISRHTRPSGSLGALDREVPSAIALTRIIGAIARASSTLFRAYRAHKGYFGSAPRHY
jgi:hypothetical protein